MIRIAHRGIHNRYVENSLEAVEAAFESPADGVEVDLRQLEDDTIVLHHGETLPDPRGPSAPPRRLDELSYEQFSDLIPHNPLTLPKLLKRIPNDKRAILECKSPSDPSRFLGRLEALIDRRDRPPENLMFSSFDLPLLKQLERRCNWPLAPIVGDLDARAPEALSGGSWSELHLDQLLCGTSTLQRVRDLSPAPILAWTVNSRRRMRTLEKLGIRGIMTDNPDLFTDG